MSTGESPPGPETESPRPNQETEDKSKSRQETNNVPDDVNGKLKLAIERLSAIEKYLERLVGEDVVKFHLLILAASRCRRAKEAIAAHLVPGPQPRSAEPWWEK